jgi:hypothetical protein
VKRFGILNRPATPARQQCRLTGLAEPDIIEFRATLDGAKVSQADQFVRHNAEEIATQAAFSGVRLTLRGNRMAE